MNTAKDFNLFLSIFATDLVAEMRQNKGHLVLTDNDYITAFFGWLMLKNKTRFAKLGASLELHNGNLILTDRSN